MPGRERPRRRHRSAPRVRPDDDSPPRPLRVSQAGLTGSTPDVPSICPYRPTAVHHRSPEPHVEVIRRAPPRGSLTDPRGEPGRGRTHPRTRRRRHRRRARGVGMGAGPRARRRPHQQELCRAADRGGRPRSRSTGRPVLRRRRPLVVRRPDPPRHGLHRRRLDGRRLPGVEDRRAAVDHAAHADRRAEAALQPPSPDPRGRDRRSGQAARLEGAVHRRRRSRLAGDALPRGRRGRHDRDRRLRHRRPVEPAAPGHPRQRPDRREEGRLGPADDRGASTRT